MDHNQEWDFEQTLAESEIMLNSAARDDDDVEFSIESILAEFGDEDLASLLGNRTDEKAADEEENAPASLPIVDELPSDEDDEPVAEEPEAEQETAPEGERSASPAPQPESEPKPEPEPEPPSISLQEVMAQTVQSALDEKEPVILEPPHRRTLFSRKKLQDTEQLFDTDELAEEEENEEEDDSFFDAPEPPVEETLSHYRKSLKSALGSLRLSVLITALMWLPQLLERLGALPEHFTSDPLVGTLPFAVALVAVCILGRSIFVRAWERICEKSVSCELMVCLLCITALADTVLCLLSSARGALVQPFYALAALAMTFALWGRFLYLASMYDTFRIAAIGQAPYMITLTAGGAAKRDGSVRGFSNCTAREDFATHWQEVLLPVILMATLVFALLSTLKAESALLFLWNWSVLLSGAAALSFPLVYALPLRRITDRLTKGGSAVGGFAGADAIRRSNCLILTDSDLFPPGTISLNGIKIFGEESGKVISYAATMARAAESGLARLFDDLLLSEGGFHEQVTDVEFFEEGGVGGTIHGESVLLGTEGFFRKKGIILPHGLKLKTGVFLAVDGTLIAIFAVKYHPAENVDWALHALHRNRITPVLAVRDGNITPLLLKRKFGTDARAVYPKLSTRLALSEHDGDRPYALLLREGLTPYAEVAVGSKRLCRAVRVGSFLSLLSSVLGTLLAFYLTFVSAQRALSPLTMLSYLLLWAIAALIDGFFVDRY